MKPGAVWHGVAWFGAAWPDSVGQDKTRRLSLMFFTKIWRNEMRPGKA